MKDAEVFPFGYVDFALQPLHFGAEWGEGGVELFKFFPFFFKHLDLGFLALYLHDGIKPVVQDRSGRQPVLVNIGTVEGIDHSAQLAFQRIGSQSKLINSLGIVFPF